MLARSHRRRINLLGASLLALGLSLMMTTAARAYTFADWAGDQGYTPGQNMPATVSADAASIDDLSGIMNYNWNYTPTVTLELQDNQISAIASSQFGSLNGLQTLDLSGNAINSLAYSSFVGLTSLTTLDLSNNTLPVTSPGKFNGMTSLQVLRLQNNAITMVEPGSFSSLTALNTLNLDSNNIQTIRASGFNGLVNVTQLTLSNNPLITIESGGFDGLSGLSSLTISGTTLHELGAQAFSNMTSLTTLDLSNNNITILKPAVFTTVTGLQDLDLSGNTSLTHLNLDYADFPSLTGFDVEQNTAVTHVSLRNADVNQTSLAAIMDGGSPSRTGVAELPSVTDLDLSGVSFSGFTSLSLLYGLDDLVNLRLERCPGLNAYALDTLLDNLDTIEGTAVEGTLFMSKLDYEVLNTAGGGLLAAWNAEDGHHVCGSEVPGDATCDGQVTAADAKIVADNWGHADLTWFEGDFNHDGKVNAADASIMAANWGNHNEGEGNVVPEPSVAFLLFGMLFTLVARRGRR